MKQYDALERAIVNATRVAVWRRGTEYLVIPMELKLQGGREAIIARHPTTGSRLVLFLDETERIEVLR